MDQGSGVGVFHKPEGAVGGFFYVSDPAAYVPALGGFGSAFAVEDYADERFAS